jgi:hypothetical protein
MLRPVLRKRDLAAEQRPPAPFVVGVTRSGTTLLRLMLDSHPEMTIPPETHFLPKLIRIANKPHTTPEKLAAKVASHRRWGDFDISRRELEVTFRRLRPLNATSAARAVYDLYAKRHGVRRWGDKTPGYQIRMLKLLKALPEARFIHVIRDGRDVALSQARKASDPTPLDMAGRRWKSRILAARRRARRLPEGTYLEVRYEDLVTDTEPTLRRVCELIELDFDPAMLRYHEHAGERLEEIAKELPGAEGKRELGAERRVAAHALTRQPPDAERVEVWRGEMSDDDVAAFEGSCGDLLAELGYPVVSEAGKQAAERGVVRGQERATEADERAAAGERGAE